MRKLHGLLSAFLFLCLQASSQTKEISGTVKDAKDGSPLSGVTVSVKGASQSTVTDNNGVFHFNIAENAETLIFSYTGYQDAELPASSLMTVSLQPGDGSLREVIVVGYGTRARRDVTGSVAKVASKEIVNTPVTSFESAIQGRAAGVFVESENGKLGQGIKIRIRGSSSVTAGNEPLYVVDGIPVTTTDLSSNGAPTNPLADININDIESVEILKDASAAAIYGSRASNGVVLITTKKGKNGQSKIDVGFFTGWQTPTHKRKFLNAEQYVEYYTDAAIRGAKYDYLLNSDFYNSIGWSEQDVIDDNVSFTESRFNRYSAGNDDWKTHKVNTNWQDQAFQKAPMSQVDLSISGGNDKTTFYMSGQFLDQKGILISNGFQRYTGRVNLDHKVRDWLTVGMNMSYSRSQNNRVSNDNVFATPLQIVALSPITPVIDPRTGLLSGQLDPNTGNPNTNYPVYYNPLLDTKGSVYNTTVNRILGNVYGEAKILKGLSFRSELGLDQLNQNEDAYFGPITVRNTSAPRGDAFYTSDAIVNVNTNNFFHYTTLISDDHDLDLVGGMSYQEENYKSSYAEAEQFPSEAYRKLITGAVKKDASTTETGSTLLSYFVRANYKLRNRYLLALSGRYDGSSRFGKNNRWGFFPAASVGWIVSEEEFFKPVETINFLKLKASYGLTGNAAIGNFAALGLWGGDAAYGGTPGQAPSQLANPDLKWESTKSFDAGFDIGILNSRINVEFDYYERNTTDLLLNVNVPSTSGFQTQLKNVGKLNNRGYEVTLNTQNIVGPKFRWTSSFNFAANRNKVTDLQGQQLGTGQNRAMEGQPLGVFVAREFAGADPENGDALYVKNTLKTDGSRDRTLTNDYNAAEEVIIGDPNPDYIYGFRNVFTYNGIEVDLLLQGVQGNQVFDGGGAYYSANGSNGFDNQTVDQLNAWKQPGDKTMVPEARLFFANGTDPSSRYILDGSYLRVKSLTVAYSLPSDLMKRWNLERVRLYVRGQNLATFTKYKGWDPEVNADFQASNINQGQDFYSAPQIKAIVVGVNIGL